MSEDADAAKAVNRRMLDQAARRHPMSLRTRTAFEAVHRHHFLDSVFVPKRLGTREAPREQGHGSMRWRQLNRGSDEWFEACYRDEPLIVKLDADDFPLSSSTAPWLMGAMIDLLEPAPGDRIIEIGTGTGYNAAVLAELTGSSGSVRTWEIDDQLAAIAAQSCTHGRPSQFVPAMQPPACRDVWLIV